MATEQMICQYLVENYEIKQIEGKLLTIVESLGLPSSQEAAAKGLVRQAIWDVIEKPYRGYIWESDYHKVWEFMEGLKKSHEGSSTPSKMKSVKAK